MSDPYDPNGAPDESWPPPDPAQQYAPPGQWASPARPPRPLRPRPPKSYGRFLAEVLTSAVVWVSAVAFAIGVGMFVFLFALGAFIGALASTDDNRYKTVAGDDGSDNVILQIPISGIIMGESGDGGGGLFSLVDATYGYDVKDLLVDAATDNDISGVILYMDTPGGTIYGSAAIADGVREFKEKAPDKPIHAFVASMSASGGMYAMAVVDEITADQGTLIGSIGVRMGPFPYYDGIISESGGAFVGGVETRNGITYTEITAGRGKDLGSPYRPMTAEELAVLQQGVDNAYATFVETVAKGRGLTDEDIVTKIGALIYDEVQARDLGLIDDVINRDAAYQRVAEAAGFRGDDWQIVAEPQTTSLFGLGGSAKSTANATQPPTYQDCFAPTQVLAFYGDPTAFCTRR